MCCLFMEFQGLIDCILVLKSTLLSVAENGDKLGVETFSIAIVTAALTDGSEMSLLPISYLILSALRNFPDEKFFSAQGHVFSAQDDMQMSLTFRPITRHLTKRQQLENGVQYQLPYLQRWPSAIPFIYICDVCTINFCIFIKAFFHIKVRTYIE